MKNIHETAKPLYLTIREDLLADFQVNQNRNIPTEKELCEKYKVCRPTVVKALSYFIENDMIIRRPGKGSYFREDALESANKIREVWGVIRQDWEQWTGDYYFCSVIQGLVVGLGADCRLSLEKYSVSLLNKLMADDKAASVWISPERTEIAAMKQLADAERRVVAVNRSFDYPGVRTASIDHAAAGRRAAAEWAAVSARRVCIVHVALESVLHREMMNGFREAAAAEAPPLACREVAVEHEDWQRRAAATFRRLLDEGERAFFVGTTALVPMALQALSEAGLEPGRDAGLLVYGDDFDYEKTGVAALRQPGAQLGQWAGEFVHGRHRESRHLFADMELMRRASLPVTAAAVEAGAV